MGDQGQVHAFLHRRGAEEGKTGLAAGHDVLVVTEDGQRVRSQGTGRNMEDAGKQFTGDLVHVGDHEQQALGSGVGAGQGAGGQHAVHHEVLAPLGGHFVHDFAHDGRRGNGVNGSRVRQSVGNIRGGVIAVHGFHFRHLFLLARLSWRACFSGMDTPAGRWSFLCKQRGSIASCRGMRAGAARAEEARKKRPGPCLFAMDEPYHKIVCLNSLMWSGCEKKCTGIFARETKELGRYGTAAAPQDAWPPPLSLFRLPTKKGDKRQLRKIP